MWKANWEETKQHFMDWWARDGLVVGKWYAPEWEGVCHDPVEAVPPPENTESQYTDVDWRTRFNHSCLARQSFPMDILPIADTHIGPGTLALYLGAIPEFNEDTVWYHPNIMDVEDPEELPPFTFDPSNKWWQTTEQTLRAGVEKANGNYLVGCPDLIENVDILSSLRDPQTFMMDMIESPEWVEASVRQINQVWFEAFQRIYDIIKTPEGGNAFDAFRIWGPGKTAKVQCDACAMFSPEMFRRMVMPGLAEQCEWLDYSVYHLDGTQAMCHLEALLEIEGLDAIEWTPQAGIEEGGHPRWHDLYRTIIEGGKSVQVIGVKIDEIVPLLNTIGSKGVYLQTEFDTREELAEIERIVKRYR